MDEGTPLGGLEPEDDTKPSHGLHAVFSSLWGRGHLAHRPGIRDVYKRQVPSAPEGETLHVEGEQCGVMPDQNWQTPYLRYLHRGELPLDRAEARRLARRAKSFVLLGDGKELYHRSPSGILQRCISVVEGQELLQEIHSGACGHHDKKYKLYSFSL